MPMSLPGTLDENARRRFEAAWRQGKPEPIEHFLPAVQDAGYRATLEELVHIDLEFTWKTGNPSADATAPTEIRPGFVEAYLARFPCLREPACVLQLLQQEYLVRHRFGDRPAVSEYQTRFPDVIRTGQELERGLKDPTTLPHKGRVSARSPGSRLDHYQLCAEHGRGGFGLVWRADDENLGREVALKQLSEDLAAHPSYRQRFLAEARIAARLQHPGIVPVYELSAPETEHPYYTMKLVRGQTLTEAIRRFHDVLSPSERALENQRLLSAFLAVARAMAYSHSRGVIHRDLKPDNIVLGDYGETVILDWGLAKVRDLPVPPPAATPVRCDESAPAMLTLPGTVMGTPAYMSPEQAAGQIDEVDERSDVYALGAIVYQLLTGAAPYQGSSSREILEQVTTRAPAPPRSLDPRIPRPLEAICLRAMARDRQQRYAEVGLLVEDLERYLADEPMATYEGTWRERARRWARHHRTAVASTIVALVLGIAAAVGGLFLWQTEEHRREQQAAKHLTDLQRSAEDGEAFAFAELRAGRYTGAEKILHHTVAALQDEPQLEAYRFRLETRLQRTRGLVNFYRLADQAEKLAFLESDAEALAACTSALSSLGILHDPEWAAHLPAADLVDPADADPEHLLRQLREDVYRTIGLLAALYVRPVVMKGSDDPETQDACRSALATVERFHRFRPSLSGRLIELFCYLRLGQLQRVLAWKPVAEPTSATDYYFSGIAHLWLAAAEQDDSIRRFLELPLTRTLIGLDFRKARQTSERHLRTAADREPRHYWTQFWLAWSLSAVGNLPAAAQAYDTCVALRPDYALAYAQRGQLLILQMPQTPDVDRRRELERRGLEDLNRAQTLERDEPFIYWLRANAFTYLGRVPDALEAFGRAMELERPLAYWKGQHIVQEKQQLLQQAADFAKMVTTREPGHADAWAVRAAAQLALGETAEAQTAVRRALQLRADHTRALAVQRALQLQAR